MKGVLVQPDVLKEFNTAANQVRNLRLESKSVAMYKAAEPERATESPVSLLLFANKIHVDFLYDHMVLSASNTL